MSEKNRYFELFIHYRKYMVKICSIVAHYAMHR